ncbi:MAG: transglutaminase family protein [Micrococcales bacterium]|nr:transglutaminase family protein [Micrococcales bacterium]
MTRSVEARLLIRAAADTAYVFAGAVARGYSLTDELLTFRLDGAAVARTELAEGAGRLQVFSAGAGELEIRYRAEVEGRPLPAPADALDAVRYVRPSRYCESDALSPVAREQFAGLAGAELAFAVTGWVHDRLSYVPRSTASGDGAIATLEKREGVCRDYAHLTAALLRAMDMPARVVAVYAPQLEPMDFHAVVEAMIEGRWYVFDATGLAPRTGLVRIATGRDAADTAFLSNTLADVQLLELEVRAAASEQLRDEGAELIELA